MSESRLIESSTYVHVAATLLIALFLSGCGASGSIGVLSVSKTGFISQADRICWEADQTQQRKLVAYSTKYRESFEKLSPVAGEETVVRDITLPSVKKQIRELEFLEAPKGEEKEVDAIIAGWRAAVRNGEEDPYSVAAWHLRNRDSFVEINAVAARYGFNDCEDLR